MSARFSCLTCCRACMLSVAILRLMQTAVCAVRACQCLTCRLAFGALLACLLAVGGRCTAHEQVIDYMLRPVADVAAR